MSTTVDRGGGAKAGQGGLEVGPSQEAGPGGGDKASVSDSTPPSPSAPGYKSNQLDWGGKGRLGRKESNPAGTDPGERQLFLIFVLCFYAGENLRCFPVSQIKQNGNRFYVAI